MRTSPLKSGWLALGLAAAAAARAAEPVKVAVFKTGFGAQAVLAALRKDAGTKPALLHKITADELLQYDVLYVGSTSLEQPEQIKGIKIFVHCGGGLILNHAACGRYRPATLFPEIARKVLDRRDDEHLLVKDAAHPLAAGLPAEFEHAFNDHLYLGPGPAGGGAGGPGRRGGGGGRRSPARAGWSSTEPCRAIGTIRRITSKPKRRRKARNCNGF